MGRPFLVPIPDPPSFLPIKLEMKGSLNNAWKPYSLNNGLSFPCLTITNIFTLQNTPIPDPLSVLPIKLDLKESLYNTRKPFSQNIRPSFSYLTTTNIFTS